MKYKDFLDWAAITIGIGGMIVWMVTYQLCVIYIRRNKKSLSKILYRDKNYLSKIDGYEMHFLIIAMSGVYLNYYLQYKRKGTFAISDLPWFPKLNDKNCLNLIKNHRFLLRISFFTFMLMLVWGIGSGVLIWLASEFNS